MTHRLRLRKASSGRKNTGNHAGQMIEVHFIFGFSCSVFHSFYSLRKILFILKRLISVSSLVYFITLSLVVDARDLDCQDQSSILLFAC